MSTHTNDPKFERRLASVASSASSWLRVDYDMVNAALGISINPEMSPLYVRKAVTARLSELPARDRSHIPISIWSLLDAMDVTGNGNFQQFNPTTPSEGAENRSGWFSVRKDPPNTFHITPRKVPPAKFMKSLRDKPRFALWEKTHRPTITRNSEAIMIKCPILTDLTEEYVERVLESF